MDSPIFDFAKDYDLSGAARMHMPGHKGNGPLGVERYDLTEIDGADDLFSPDGIIARSEAQASEIFGAHTFYSTEGSSLSIRAMLYLLEQYAAERGERVRLLAARNAHRSFISGLSLMGIDPIWLRSDSNSYLSARIDPDMLRKTISSLDKPPHALYITSPDYLGNMQNIRDIADACHDFGTLLMVDNAHGAYLKFLEKSMHPIDLGADICADSAHKTLPCLGGGGYLHISKSAPKILKDKAKSGLALFGSTSPSYLILESLDLLNGYLKDGIREDIKTATRKVDEVKNKLREIGFTVVSDEPLKITLLPKSYGYTGKEIAEHLRHDGIYVEFYDDDHLVMMPPICDGGECDRVIYSLSQIKKKEAIITVPPKTPYPVRKISPREALLSHSERVPIESALGRVAAELCISCPPAVPIVVSGEIIDNDVVSLLKYYRFEYISVTK